MEVAAFCRQTKVIIVAGKGGVGKSTVSAVLARMAGMAGVPTLLVELDGKSGLPLVFGREGPLTYEEIELVAPSVGADGGVATAWIRARRLTPDDALLDYLSDHGLGRISKRLVNSGALDVVATAVPGLRDILVLGKIKQLEREDAAGLIIVDAPATGHALSALSTPQGLADAVSVGPIRVQAQDVIGLLADKSRCQVLLVTLPEETPVNEAAQAAFEMEDKTGVNLGPVVVNSVYPQVPELSVDPGKAASQVGSALAPDQIKALGEAAFFRRSRRALQEEQLGRLAETLPLAQLRLPHLFTTKLGLEEIDHLARCLATEIENLEPA
ncbi:MAG TPA: ArsA-related P-loop ATPase [Acidimicrobiales bacterium]|nr:ArsA-related P-loop ATPase [Acidimicrobiales bacterium]